MDSQAVLAAARGVLADDPHASITKLAAAAGVSRATLYRAFPSRGALLDALAIAPDPDARARILAAALELVSRDGLRRLDMDELSAAAGVSRATLYRLFPGKSQLFADLVRDATPFAAVLDLLAREPDSVPAVMLPRLACTVASAIADRLGIIRTLIFEMTSGDAETRAAAAHVFGGAFAALARYLGGQMAAGRLRAMPPLLAAQSFVGPLMMHALTRPLLPADLPLEEAATELAQAWVRGMTAQRP